MVDACGDEASDCPFNCEVQRVDLSDMSKEQIESARKCVGMDLNDLPADCHELATVEACVQYGAAQPLESFNGAKYPERIRAQARRYAEACRRDAALLADRLDRPVNAIGSTAAEYARGDISSALFRSPHTSAKELMLKLGVR
jgi:hypothetical protein